MIVEILCILKLPGKTCNTLVMKVRDGHDRNNTSITGRYNKVDHKVNGRSYYYNDEAKRYIYSSQKGIWFVCKQYIIESSSIIFMKGMIYHLNIFYYNGYRYRHPCHMKILKHYESPRKS